MLNWLVPAITGILLIELGGERDGIIGMAGLIVGGFQVIAALIVAWAMYVKR